MPAKLTNTIIEAAIYGFEAQKRSLDTQIAELRAMLNRAPAHTAESDSTESGPRRKISAAARKRMAEGQRKRWATLKGEAAAEPQAASSKAKVKRKISAAGKAAIVAATKKRWAAYRAAKAGKK